MTPKTKVRNFKMIAGGNLPEIFNKFMHTESERFSLKADETKVTQVFAENGKTLADTYQNQFKKSHKTGQPLY